LKGGIAAVHLALVSLSYVTFYTFPLSKANGNGAANGTTNGAASGAGPVRFGAETDWWGNAEVGILPVEDWTENEAQAELLAGKCDQLFRDFSEKRRESAIDS
jgi:3-keto steroid reductase